MEAHENSMVEHKKDESPFFTPQEVARYLKVSKSTVYRLVSEGILPSAKIHGRGSLRIFKVDLENFIRQKRAEASSCE